MYKTQEGTPHFVSGFFSDSFRRRPAAKKAIPETGMAFCCYLRSAAAVVAAAVAAPAVVAAAAEQDDDEDDDPQAAPATKTIVIAAPHKKYLLDKRCGKRRCVSQSILCHRLRQVHPQENTFVQRRPL